MTRESVIETYLTDRVKALGGEVRKVAWVNRSSAPDRLVLLPGRAVFVEVKRPGERPTAAQEREARRLASAGLNVTWADTCARVDEILRGKL